MGADEDFTKELGERMRARREYLRMTQQDVADELGINRVTYTQWERGVARVLAVDVMRVAKALTTTAAYLFGEDSPSTGTLGNFSDLSPSMRDAILGVIEAARSQS